MLSEGTAMSEKDRPGHAQIGFGYWLLLAFYALLTAAFFIMRYNSRTIDTDTAALSLAITNVVEKGTLNPDGPIYGLGFSLQSVSAVLLTVTGMSVENLQTTVYPFLAAVISMSLAFAFFRELTAHPYKGMLATLFLFLQPDFLFVTFRGSHEKLTWTLVLMALYLLVKSFSETLNLRRFAVYVGLFYLTIFALASTNAFFASSFTSAIAFSFVGGYTLLLLRRSNEFVGEILPHLRRFVYITLSSFGVLTLVMFYLYPPAQQSLFALKRLAQKLATLLLGFEPASGPYHIISFGWISAQVYLLLTVFNWIVGLVSLLTWFPMMLHRRLLDSPKRFTHWLLYLAFAVQIAAGALADSSGTLGANLQLRLFPAFMIVAIPMAVAGLTSFFRLIHIRQRLRNALLIMFFILVLWFKSAAFLKATNEPTLSNYWSFYKNTEVTALEWTDAHLRYRKIWMDFDGIRLGPLWEMINANTRSANRTDVGTVDEGTNDFLISAPVRMWGARNNRVLPDVVQEHTVYDNGEVQLYHRRPRTPYQQ